MLQLFTGQADEQHQVVRRLGGGEDLAVGREVVGHHVQHRAFAFGQQYRQGSGRGLELVFAEGPCCLALLHAHHQEAQSRAQQRRQDVLQWRGHVATWRYERPQAAALLVAGVLQHGVGADLKARVLWVAVGQKVSLGVAPCFGLIAVQPGISLGIKTGLHTVTAQAAMPVHKGVVVGGASPVVDGHAALQAGEVKRELIAFGKRQDAFPPQRAKAFHAGVVVRAQHHRGGGQWRDGCQWAARRVKVHLRTHGGHVVVAQASHGTGFFFRVVARGVLKRPEEIGRGRAQVTGLGQTTKADGVVHVQAQGRLRKVFMGHGLGAARELCRRQMPLVHELHAPHRRAKLGVVGDAHPVDVEISLSVHRQFSQRVVQRFFGANQHGVDG